MSRTVSEKLFFRLSPELRAEIERLAAANERSISGQVRLAVKEHVKHERQRAEEAAKR